MNKNKDNKTQCIEVSKLQKQQSCEHKNSIDKRNENKIRR